MSRALTKLIRAAVCISALLTAFVTHSMELRVGHNHKLSPRLLTELQARYHSAGLPVTLTFEEMDTLTYAPEDQSEDQPHVVMVIADKLGMPGMHFQTIDAEWLSPTTSQQFVDTVTFDNEVKGIPVWAGNQVMLFYNKSLVTGVAEAFEQLPEALKGGQPIRESIGYPCTGPYFVVPVLQAFGGDLMAGDRATLNSPAMVKTIAWLREQKANKLFVKSCDFVTSFEAFSVGKLPYLFAVDSAYATLYSTLKENLGMVDFPDVAGNQAYGYYSTKVIALPRKTYTGDELAQIKRFTDIIQGYDIQQLLLLIDFKLPVHYRMFSSLQAYPSVDFKYAFMQLNRNTAIPSSEHMFYVWQVLIEYLPQLVDSSAAVKPLLIEMQKEVEHRISNAN